MLQVTAARVGVALAERVEHLLHGDVVRLEPGHIEVHLILLEEAAKRDHVGHSRGEAQLALDYPILQRAQFGEVVAGTTEICALRGAEGEDWALERRGGRVTLRPLD